MLFWLGIVFAVAKATRETRAAAGGDPNEVGHYGIGKLKPSFWVGFVRFSSKSITPGATLYYTDRSLRSNIVQPLPYWLFHNSGLRLVCNTAETIMVLFFSSTV